MAVLTHGRKSHRSSIRPRWVAAHSRSALRPRVVPHRRAVQLRLCDAQPGACLQVVHQPAGFPGAAWHVDCPSKTPTCASLHTGGQYGMLVGSCGIRSLGDPGTPCRALGWFAAQASPGEDHCGFSSPQRPQRRGTPRPYVHPVVGDHVRSPRCVSPLRHRAAPSTQRFRIIGRFLPPGRTNKGVLCG